MPIYGQIHYDCSNTCHAIKLIFGTMFCCRSWLWFKEERDLPTSEYILLMRSFVSVSIHRCPLVASLFFMHLLVYFLFQEINDQPPNPNQPVPNPRLVPKPKVWFLRIPFVFSCFFLLLNPYQFVNYEYSLKYSMMFNGFDSQKWSNK